MTADATVVLGYTGAARAAAARMSAQRAIQAAQAQANAIRAAGNSRTRGAAGVLQTPNGPVYPGVSSLLRPPGTVVAPPLPVNPVFVEGATTQTAGAPNLPGSQNATDLVC